MSTRPDFALAEAILKACGMDAAEFTAMTFHCSVHDGATLTTRQQIWRADISELETVVTRWVPEKVDP